MNGLKYVNCGLYLEMLILVFRSCLLGNSIYAKHSLCLSELPDLCYKGCSVCTESNGLFTDLYFMTFLFLLF